MLHATSHNMRSASEAHGHDGDSMIDNYDDNYPQQLSTIIWHEN